MLVPELPQNRAAFDRLGRLKLMGIPVMLVIAIPWIIFVPELLDYDTGALSAAIMALPLIGYGLFLVYLEGRRLSILRNDLIQRRNTFQNRDAESGASDT